MVGAFEAVQRHHRSHPPKRWRLRRAFDVLISAMAVTISLVVVPLLLIVFALCLAFEYVRQYFGDRIR